MAAFTSQEQQQIHAAFAKAAMEAQAEPPHTRDIAAPAALAAAGPGAGAKDIFCKNWPLVKEVLTLLKSAVGGIAGMAVGVVIAAGDALFNGGFCKT